MLSRRLGKRALLLGAVAQNLPDVDTVAALWLPASENLLVHRGITHSVLFAVLVAALLSAVAGRWSRTKQVPWQQWLAFFLVQFLVHDLIDTCNAYGTGLLEPFSQERFSVHLLFVADPLFTLWPSLALVVLALGKYVRAVRVKWALAGLVPSVLYLGCAFWNKVQVQDQVNAALAQQQVKAEELLITPTPFNSWLWFVAAKAGNGYHIGHQSALWKEGESGRFTYYPQGRELLTVAHDPQEVQHLLQFADDFYLVNQHQDTLVFNVLRFGQMQGWQNPEATFTFHYYLRPEGIDNQLVMQRGRMKGWSTKTVRQMLRAIFVEPADRRPVPVLR